MSDDLEFIVIDDIPEYIFCIGDDEENEQVIALSGKDGAFKYEKVDELPTAGEDGVLYLVPKSHTTQTASGNPININITDNAGKIESLKLNGDTFQQTYTGKNLLMNKESAQEKTGITITPNSDGSFTLNGAATATTDFYFVGSWQNRTISYLDMPSGDYTISLLDSTKQQIASPKFRVELYDRMGEKSSRILWLPQGLASPQTTNVASYAQVTAYYISIQNGTSFSNEKFYIQLETGASATSFEPYVGGRPSPNPSYPQDINVVTGTQTISINGTNYPLDLGDIQLCGLGDDGNGNPLYKDRIYRDGDDWKIHKATASGRMSSADNWVIPNPPSYPNLFQAVVNRLDLAPEYVLNSSALEALCEELTYMDSGAVRTAQGFAIYNNDGSKLVRINHADFTTVAQLKDWLSNNNVEILFALATPTDTVITDTTLIAQLESIRTASLENGTNTITNTATGSNLAGDLEIGYYGYDPLNKYDKYFWLDVDGEYESI